MDFLSICKQRYATKKFSGEMIPEDKINELFEMLRLAPTSFGLMPYKIIVVTDKELKEKLQPASWNQPQITTCSHLLVFCADENQEDYLARYLKVLEDAGAPKESREGYEKMVSGFLSAMDQEKRVAWATKQSYIALAHGMLGAKALGFDSCPMEGFQADKYKEILQLDDNLHPTVLLPLGIADDTPRPKTRFPTKDIFIRK